MMDGHSLYPDGFHPSWQDRSGKDIVLDAPYRSRHEAGPVRYYIIDFGMSRYYSDPTQPRLANTLKAQDLTVPEFEDMRSYEAFPADVYTLGNVFKRKLVNVSSSSPIFHVSFLTTSHQIYSNINFLNPLVDRMTQRNPSDRPTASEASDEFELVVSKLRKLKIHWRLHKRDESWLPMVLRDARAAAGETRRHSWACIRKSKLHSVLMTANSDISLASHHKSN